MSSLGVGPIAPPIHPRSPVPKYSQLREVLFDLIESELTPDAPIPSERELAQRHGLHRMTVRQAVDQLVSQGRLYRVPRRGTFVARPKLQMRLTLTSFTQDMRGLGLRPGAVTLAAARIQAGSADSSDARVLGLPVGAPVLKFQRTSFAGEQPAEFVVSTYRGDRYQFRVALDAPTRAHPQGGIA